MRVVFRVDASSTIGTGHVMRCLTLAGGLRECGATVSFVCRAHVGHLGELIRERGFVVGLLPAPRAGYGASETSTHGAWLGSSWQEDANQTRALIKTLNPNPDWLVVDHYALDHRWERALRPEAGRILAIDDLADRIHDCDLLLDQNLVAGVNTRYAGKVPIHCRLLLGPTHALLQPCYAELRERVRPRTGPVRRLLVYFGGSDDDNLTGRALTAILGIHEPDIEADVVIGDAHPHESSIRALVSGHRNIHLHFSVPTLATLISTADLGIGAPGATSWERICLGLFAVVITLAENQRGLAEELHRLRLVRWLGHKDTVDDGTIRRALEELLAAPRSPGSLSQVDVTVDGRGLGRVRDVVLGMSTEPQ